MQPGLSRKIGYIAREAGKGQPRGRAKLLADFVRLYFAEISRQDLAAKPPAEWVAIARAHFDALRGWCRGPGLVRSYNPTVEKDGRESDHSVLEVVTWDMPFLVDSVTMELNRHGFSSHLAIHPIITVSRTASGELAHVAAVDGAGTGGRPVSLIYIEFDKESEHSALSALSRDLKRVLADVRLAVADWRKMIDRVEEALTALSTNPPPLAPAEVTESAAFLRWLLDDNFTFLGYRDYDLIRSANEDELHVVKGTGLGILRKRTREQTSSAFDKLPAALRRQARRKNLLTITKSNSRSTIHRPVYLDYIGVKRFGASGNVVGERRILGLYTSKAYLSNPRQIPYIRQKVTEVVRRSGYMINSHSGKALINILDTYPRDELLQASAKELFATAMGIAELQERQRVRLFLRTDPYERYLACLVFVPKEAFNSVVREKIQNLLLAAFAGTSVDFTTWISESAYARLYLIIHTRPGGIPRYRPQKLETAITEVTRTWQDRLHDELLRSCGWEQGAELYHRYRQAFDAAYCQDHAAQAAVADISHVEQALHDNTLVVNLYRDKGAGSDELMLKLFNPGRAIPLSRVLPILENMGLFVRSQSPYEITPREGAALWLYAFTMRTDLTTVVELQKVKTKFQQAFAQVWQGVIENDRFNSLVLGAGLTAREILVLRVYAKYSRQIGTRFSQAYIEDTLIKHPGIASRLIELFVTKFTPQRIAGRKKRLQELADAIERMVDQVPSLDEDRILRRFYQLMAASLRTNYFQRGRNGVGKAYVSVKFDPGQIAELPLPVPKFEIFVYSPEVEGVHLRGGKVARGGLRWSDRREDFRTEILGLMRAQMVKNTVIVPVGAKGGFYVKNPGTGGRKQLLEQGIRCYRTFIRGLLDITDNRVMGRTVRPDKVVAYDGDDPYLVVAADKGTATFSDIANDVAAQYEFWLGDAFASGGSVGYDHKKMGITARGAWESVKHHLQIREHDPQQPITVIGIGDMSGDVFGNGMLLSNKLKLVAAFNHLHIFLDPDPDPAASYRERRRLFRLRGSNWTDYDRHKISRGGGVFARCAKSVTLSNEVKALLRTDSDRVTPTALIRLLLQAPVDLIWNGGIGTYIKAGTEAHAEVGDKTNDELRINAAELRCRVIGEGGNLGITQRARIAFAHAGGSINADWIDNSGGVDCSDHEVNIKILLNGLVAGGRLRIGERNKLLRDMRNDVAALVLQNNYRQARAITVAELESRQRLGWYIQLLRELEHEDGFDRMQEYLPDDAELDQRRQAGTGLKRPEIAVVLAFTKAALYKSILASDLPDDPYLESLLLRYFPEPLQKNYASQIRSHELRREIIATVVTNSMVNRAGVTFGPRLADEIGCPVAEITRAYLLSRDVFDIRRLWTQIDKLDNKAAVTAQFLLVTEVQHLLRHTTRWFLRNPRLLADPEATVKRYAGGVRILGDILWQVLDRNQGRFVMQIARRMVVEGVPKSVARRFAGLRGEFEALEIMKLAMGEGFDFRFAAAVFYTVGARLRLYEIHKFLNLLSVDSTWHDRARTEMIQELTALQAQLTADAIHVAPGQRRAAMIVDGWLERNAARRRRFSDVLQELEAAETVDLSMLSVAVGKLRRLRDVPGARVGSLRRSGPQQNYTKGCGE